MWAQLVYFPIFALGKIGYFGAEHRYYEACILLKSILDTMSQAVVTRAEFPPLVPSHLPLQSGYKLVHAGQGQGL